MVCIGMDLKDPLVLTPLPWAETPSHRFVCSGLHPACLKHLQGWGIHSFSDQPVPLPHHLTAKNFILTSNLNLLQFEALSCISLVLCLQKVFLLEFLQVLEGHTIRLPQSLFFPGRTIPIFSAFPQWRDAPPIQSSWCPSSGLTPTCWYSSSCWGP